MTFVSLVRHIIHRVQSGYRSRDIIPNTIKYYERNNIMIDLDNFKTLLLLNTLFIDHNVNITQQQSVIFILTILKKQISK